MTDYSEGGARLLYEQTVRLPHRFGLCFDGFRMQIPCEIRYNEQGAVGVEFAKAKTRPSSRSVCVLEEFLIWLNR